MNISGKVTTKYQTDLIEKKIERNIHNTHSNRPNSLHSHSDCDSHIRKLIRSNNDIEEVHACVAMAGQFL